MKYTKYLIAAAISAIMLTACSAQNTSSQSAPDSSAPAQTTQAQVQTQEADALPEGALLVDFVNGISEKCEMANGWTNGGVFDCTWRKDNITFLDGKMQLTISEDTFPTSTTRYAGAEYRSLEFFGYGRYEVSMKAIKNSGVVSSFFTYTGPSDNNPWDEIDVEVLGKDTTKVQFNYYTNGTGGHEYMYDLGFDASEDFHTYAIDWAEGKITWYVDGVEAYSADKNIPVTPSKIMMNTWNGINVDSWLGAFDDSKMPLTAEYEWFSFTPAE